MTHKPSEGALHYPTPSQDFKSPRIIRSFDYLYFQFGTDRLDPLRKCLSGIAAVDPEQAQPGKTNQGVCEQALGALALRSTGRSYENPQQQTQSIDQNM